MGLPGKPNHLLRVAIYARKSNKSEGRSRSIVEQVDSCRQVCDYYGFDPANITSYEEAEGQKGDSYWRDGESRNPEPWRPELTRLMNDVNAGKIDIVCVWRSDRLYRDSGVCDALMKVFRVNGIKFICGLRDMDVDSATGLYQASVEAANNRRYRDQTSEDIKRDHDFKAELGLFSRNPSCLGYRSKGKGTQAVEPIWEEIDLVNRIFNLFVHGEGDAGPLGINAICRLLMDEDIPIARGAKGHKPKDPKRVHTSQIKTILTNCMYIAKWRHRGQEFDCDRLLVPARDGSNTMETVVPIVLFEAAQTKLLLTDRPGKKSVYSEHLLSGLLVCAYCGRPLHVHYEPRVKGKENPRDTSKWYVCSNRKPPGYCKPFGMRMIQEDILDDWVLKELAPLLVAEMESVRSAVGRDIDTQALAEMERTAIDLRKKETHSLMNMLGVFDKEQMAMLAADLRVKREQLERKIQELRLRLSKHTDLPDLTSDTLTSMPKMAIKDTLRRAIQWIAIGKDGIIILSSFGTYIGATFRDIEKGTYFTSKTRTTIYPPTPDAALRCLQWLPLPEDFVKGRRYSIGHRADVLTDAEILPGIDTLGIDSGTEVEVNIVIEDIKLDN